MKKIISFILTLSLCMSMAVTSFAADGEGDSSEIPGVQKTTITYEIPAPDSEDGEAGIQPMMWDQGTWETSKQRAYTPVFTIPDRYFAYEISATSGNPSGEFAVALLLNDYSTITHSITHTANGTMKKADWIDVLAGREYQFRVSNLTGSNLKFTITYYSWK